MQKCLLVRLFWSLCLVIGSALPSIAFAQEESSEVVADEINSVQEQPSADDSAVISAPATNYQCELRGNVRRVEIQYAEDGQTVPCSVVYYKDTEAPGSERVLWSANNQPGYCENQAQEFVLKLQTWGWECQ
ncbi:hypothetical protein [Sessilibacter corallicola]|uniref:Ig-like domain-containing protein n=1 Tax=Sessilibacter corallicola TaxID=2904075 RepID=A0ABQ0AB29_9GAMM|nr:hypothetical protein [Sessilibacter corallicola]MCE2028291.1 hypothetical protein [Sessilibacter corallicola]